MATGIGINIQYGHLVPNNSQAELDQLLIIEQVNEWVELTLMAQAAVTQGENIDAQLQDYAHH